jgi:hypothetical protein
LLGNKNVTEGFDCLLFVDLAALRIDDSQGQVIDRALVPILDLAQHSWKIFKDRFRAFADRW